VRVSSA